MGEAESTEPIRLDKWLWAARFFKTRSLAAEAVEGGKVHLSGARTKPGHVVRIGNELKIRRGPYEWVVIVRAISAKRGPAAQAQLLYEETEESKKIREVLAAQLRLQGEPGLGLQGRPTKKSRREIMGVKRRGW
jgi:ribosome-associated heat shock protein Hsp15